MEFLSQKPMYSKEPGTKGFDLSSGNIWIYPENYPVREYQFQIVQSALYNNTLVCLPTGLGKTFVAAVVMYNFWRWYPQGIIVFLAPTKPLVAQQINACQEIMGIPATETIELTGTTDQKKRKALWLQHRVIFATPQVFQKDLEKNVVPSDRVKCVVVDEAHKALGKHSYCESIRLLSEQNEHYRVLALSATPGGKLDAVQEVVKNLRITHMELRDDTSPDIIPYINERKLDIVLVGLGAELEGFKDRYVTIMDRHVRPLVENNVLRGFAGNISKGRIFHLHKEWQQKSNKSGNHGQIMKTLTILMTMYHAYELMIRHGLRAFYNFYQNHRDKFWLSDEKDLHGLLEEINYYLGPFPEIRNMPNGIVPEVPEDIRFGHNKFQKLKEILLRHFESFESKEEETRAIVFVEYRDIVNEVYVLLLQSRPLIRPQKFVGQAGLKQKQQKLALENFRSNKVNVLISTSVGEEGLDVGEVDLIVCFDISQQSPIRLVQRMGRTGRKRDGHIVVLVTDGKEHQTLKSTMSRRDSLNTKVLHSSGIISALHEKSPRMVPAEFAPECRKLTMMIVPKPVTTKSKSKTKEPKKPQNRKTKNSKIPESSTSNKSGAGQSLLMRFLKKASDDPPTEADDDIVAATMNAIPVLSFSTNRTTQCSQQSLKINNAIKSSEVRLLTSDDAAVDFLTLCTMKKSENEHTCNEKYKVEPYIPIHRTENDENENFFDFEIPDIRILDCLKNLTDCVVPSIDGDKDDDVGLCEASERFDDCDDFYESPNRGIHEEDSKFEALLDESTDDSEPNVAENEKPETTNFPTNECVDWGENVDDMNFEELLDETSAESKISSEKNAIEINEADETGRRTSVDVLDERGSFEDILDFSSNDSEIHWSPRNSNVESEAVCVEPSSARVAEKMADEEPEGLFEDILNCSSDDSETDTIVRTKRDVSAATEQTSGRKNVVERTIDDECERSITVDSPFDDDKFRPETDFHPRNPFSTKNSDEAVEIILSSSSDETKSECLVELKPDAFNVTVKNSPTENSIERSTSVDFRGTFEDILNSSTDGSETDYSFNAQSDAPSATKKTSATKNSIERSISDETKKITEAGGNSSTDDSETDCSLDLSINSIRRPKITSATKISHDFEIVASNDRLDDRTTPTNVASVDYDRRNSNVFGNVPKASTSGLSSKNSSQNTSHSLLTISQMLREVERINTGKKVNNGNEVNNKFGESSEDERSTSPVFPDRPPASRRSLSYATGLPANSTESFSPREKNSPNEIIISDEDIFGTDDLTVDSDFEAKIISIEKSATGESTTVGEKKSRSPIADKDSEIAIDESGSNKIVEYPRTLTVGISKPEIKFKDCGVVRRSTKSSCSSVGTSIVSELNLDDWISDSDARKTSISKGFAKNRIADSDDLDRNNGRGTANRRTSSVKESLASTVDAADCYWTSEETKRPITPSNKRSSFDIVDLTDCDSHEEPSKNARRTRVKKKHVVDSVDVDDFDWNNEEKPNSPSVDRSVVENADFPDDCDWKDDEKNLIPLSAKKIVDEIVIDDCDWSDDFDSTSATSTAASPSLRKIGEPRESTKLIGADKIRERVEKVDKVGGWKTRERSKPRLSLGKYFANNIQKKLSNKSISDKSPADDRDSDSENEFAVGRLEVKLTKQVDSDFFAKPDPVDKTTRGQSVGMNKFRRIVRAPLSVRRTDCNVKLSINELDSFAAPNKYTQQQQQQQQKTNKKSNIGAGRQRSASADLDGRESKNKRQKKRNRGRIRSEFIEDEAEVTTDDDQSSGTSGTDEDLDGFVSYTQHADDSVDMQAHYLQTVRSPRGPGLFHIRRPRSPDTDLHIYSQPVPDEPNAYLHDSFCVAEDDEAFEDSGTPDEISLLEEMERNLKTRKRKRKKSSETRGNVKRRVIARPSDTSSSEDEFEKLRHQIRDESFMLKN